MTLDELKAALPIGDDDAALNFYCWQDAEETADCFLDDACEGLSELLQEYMRGRIKPVGIAEVEAWLKDYFDPDAIGGDAQSMAELIRDYKASL